MESVLTNRKIDDLGRVVIPKEIRSVLGWEESENIDFLVHDNGIFLTKHLPSCRHCGKTENIVEFKGKHICQKCIDDIKTM